MTTVERPKRLGKLHCTGRCKPSKRESNFYECKRHFYDSKEKYTHDLFTTIYFIGRLLISMLVTDSFF